MAVSTPEHENGNLVSQCYSKQLLLFPEIYHSEKRLFQTFVSVFFTVSYFRFISNFRLINSRANCPKS